MGKPALSVVVPAYNEAGRLATTLDALRQATARLDVEVIVVDDGSTDGTAAVARAALHATDRFVRLEVNSGKGAAVRAGVLASRGDAVVYMDADLATDLGALPEFLDALAHFDVVIGSRTLADSEVRGGTRDRAAMAWVFNLIVRLSTGIQSRDTQCGFKALRGPVARELFGLARCDRFAFDVEILLLARRLGLRVAERPVTWTAVEGTSVRRFTDSAQAALDVVGIAARWTPRRVARSMRRRASGPIPADG